MENQKRSQTEVIPVVPIVRKNAKDSTQNTGKHAKPDTGKNSISEAVAFWKKLPVSEGRYELLEPIGRGGMGIVYQAKDGFLNRRVAIKIMLPDKDKNDLRLSRFLQEARIHSQLQHPGIPSLHDIGQFSDGRAFIAMEFCRGTLLADMLEDRSDHFTGLSYYLELFEKICQTIAYAQSKGVSHRDLKPTNVLVSKFGQIHVIDWGLATINEDSSNDKANSQSESHLPTPGTAQVELNTLFETSEGDALGSANFVAPEQAKGEIGASQFRRDVFGLGALLCVILTGTPPFTGSPTVVWTKARLGSLNEAIDRLNSCGAPEPLVELAIQCLSTDPDERPADAGVVAEAINRYRSEVISRDIAKISSVLDGQPKKSGWFNPISRLFKQD
ncbi:MAG: serine/threonine-protein kinase [Gemmataceae bacterium]